MSADLSYIGEAVDTLSCSFATDPRPVKSTIQSLKRFREVFSESFDLIADAINKDFHKPKLETYIGEFAMIVAELDHIISNIHSMLTSPRPSSIPLAMSTLTTNVDKIALGTVLIIAPFNYPLNVSIAPLIAAFAAGNNVVLKFPFDQLPEFSTVMKRVIEKAFSNKEIVVVNGGIDEAQYLLNNCKFDKIFFTGSTTVGKIVYEAASKNLTPVVLELGGKSPLFITKNVKLRSLETLMSRILWGKFSNAGQICVAPDYLLVEDSVYEVVVNTLKKVYDSTYSGMTESSDYSHIINERGFNRLVKLLENTNGSIIAGGGYKKSHLFIEPTIVEDVEWNDVLMESEIFGPILPIIRYSASIKDIAMEVARQHDCPLAMYLFSEDKHELETLKKYLRSGSILVNDTLLAAGCGITPFGGIGSSGFGNYHYQWSIDTFTHQRAVLKQPLWAEPLLKVRYLPYSDSKLKQIQRLSGIPPIPIKRIKEGSLVILVFVVGWVVGWAIGKYA